MRNVPHVGGRLAGRQWCGCLLGLVFVIVGSMTMRAQERVIHTNPLNREPAVRAAYGRYTLDYDGALNRFQQVQQAHPDDPMAADYILETVLFHELYNLDLLDTTLYAHDGFRPASTRWWRIRPFPAH